MLSYLNISLSFKLVIFTLFKLEIEISQFAIGTLLLALRGHIPFYAFVLLYIASKLTCFILSASGKEECKIDGIFAEGTLLSDPK